MYATAVADAAVAGGAAATAGFHQVLDVLL